MPSPPIIKVGIYDRPCKEAILVYGDSDLGKTFNYFKIAQWHQKRGSDALFYGICTPGNRWDKFFAPGAAFEGLENVRFWEVAEIQDYYDVYNKHIDKRGRAQDWLAVDVLGDAWSAAQEEYSRREHGVDLGEKWGTEGGRIPISGKDWPWASINSRHAGFAQNRVLRFPGHVYCMAWDKSLGDLDDEEKRDRQASKLFSVVGFKNEGQKSDYKRFDTILHVSVNGKGERVTRTVRDRDGRRRVGTLARVGNTDRYTGEAINDFFTDYLIKVAGWKL